MKTACPKVSIIIPCFNEVNNIEACLQTILRQEQPAGGLECIVADGMSSDGTREILEKLSSCNSRIRIVDNKSRIASSGLNCAVSIARGEIIIRMDAHTQYASDYVVQCVALLENTGADNVGGPALTQASTYFQKANELAYHSAFAVGGAKFHNPNYEGFVDTVPYGCWRKSTLIKFGLFDEMLTRNQDDELNLRIVRAGGKIWQSPLIKSWYQPRGSIISLFQQYQQYGYWKVRVIQKHRIPASIRHIVPGGFFGVLLVLSLLAFFFSWARISLAVLFGLYLFANLCATLITCYQPVHWKYIPIMPIAFAAYHFGYGWGFLSGLSDFLLLKKSGRPLYSKLTR